MLVASARRSCTSFEIRRSIRPYIPAPIATTGTTASMRNVSFQEVYIRIAMDPKALKEKRRPMETLTVTAFCKTVVSEANRLVKLPVLFSSKKRFPVAEWK